MYIWPEFLPNLAKFMISENLTQNERCKTQDQLSSAASGLTKIVDLT